VSWRSQLSPWRPCFAPARCERSGEGFARDFLQPPATLRRRSRGHAHPDRRDHGARRAQGGGGAVPLARGRRSITNRGVVRRRRADEPSRRVGVRVVTWAHGTTGMVTMRAPVEAGPTRASATVREAARRAGLRRCRHRLLGLVTPGVPPPYSSVRSKAARARRRCGPARWFDGSGASAAVRRRRRSLAGWAQSALFAGSCGRRPTPPESMWLVAPRPQLRADVEHTPSARRSINGGRGYSPWACQASHRVPRRRSRRGGCRPREAKSKPRPLSARAT